MTTQTLDIPALSLVVLVGTSGSGKSTFAARHFAPTEILSSDFFRGLVADDENDQSASAEAFDALRYLAEKRLRAGRLTVIDATNVQPDARKPFLALARAQHCLPVAIVLDVPPRVAHERNRTRPNRAFGEHVVQNQHRQLRRSLRYLKKEGFRHVHVLTGTDAIDAATITRTPLWTDRRHDHGPFDIIGDIHGCHDELVALLQTLGHPITAPHPDGRRVIFLGDLVDRGPNIVGVLRLVMSMVKAGHALAVPGNHEQKLQKLLDGKPVRLTHGLEQTKTQLESIPEPESDTFRRELRTFLDSLVSHYVLDDGNLVVAHAGLKAEFQNRSSGKVRAFCLYGETTGETDDFGLPIRHDWAAEYRGRAQVVYGHTPVTTPEWVNRTLCIDTGCVYGGALTALRYPERELVSIPAARTYYESAKPFPNLSKPESAARTDDLLDIDDVLGKRVLHTRIPGHSTITLREENASAALEVMSRWAAPPEWLIYLPPTMSPSETCPDGPFLEHPREAFAYYQRQGIPTVVCQEKHMGSRAVVILCRDSSAAERRFRARDGRTGIVLTRTGRPFFATHALAHLEPILLERLRTAAERAGFWTRFDTDWMCLDAELMPWSLKAEELLRNQYAATATAATVSLREAIAAASATTPLADDLRARADLLERYRTAYRRYAWAVTSITDVRLAPFHLLATEGKVHVDQTHVWHMQTLSDLCAADPELLLATPYRVVDLADDQSRADAIAWWTALTSAGGEGMVVKPLDFLAPAKRGLAQPAIKCRGPEYLRIIYGPEYTTPKHLARLRARGLSGKRGMALRELALGIEALERFVEGEPLYKVHECVFGVLAMESEGVDPRL